MSILNDFKEIADFVQKAGSTDLYRKIVDLQGEVLELTVAKRELEERCQALSNQLAFKERMKFIAPYWYAEGDQTPYCPNCWERDHAAIHLVGPSYQGQRYSCPSCLTIYDQRDGLVGRIR